MTRARKLIGLLVLGLLLAQAAAGLITMLGAAHAASWAERRRAFGDSGELRLDAALGKTAPLYDELARQLANVQGQHAVVYLFPTAGLPTDLGELAVLQQAYGTPLAALLQPAAVRLLGPGLQLGKLDGDEALLLAEIGAHKELPFVALLEELARAEGFRIYRFAPGAGQ